MPLPKRDMTDWDRVKREYDSGAPIPYDPEDGPYDPNDDPAVGGYWSKATIWKSYPNPVMIQKDGVPVNQDEAAASETEKSHAKAS
jgi:hypothetical protein